MAASNANTLIGAAPADQQRWAWQQTYRAADHRPTRNKLSSASLGDKFPRAIHEFGILFAAAQQERHAADYNPYRTYSVTNVIELIDRIEDTINTFNQTADDLRRDLAIHILTTLRGA